MSEDGWLPRPPAANPPWAVTTPRRAVAHGGKGVDMSPSTAEMTAAVPGAVTVVVISRDRRDSLLNTLARLRGLPQAPPVVVVDNASSDATDQAVRDNYP